METKNKGNGLTYVGANGNNLIDDEIVVHPEGKIKLSDGSVIDGYPLVEPMALPDNTLSLDRSGTWLQMKKRPLRARPADEEAKRVEELFVRHAFFLFSRRKLVYQNSRMFLAEVPIECGLMYTGTSGFHRLTLGVYLEWWERCGNTAVKEADGEVMLVYKFGGSPLTGWNRCQMVNRQGQTINKSVDKFLPLWTSMMNINTRYDECKSRYMAYSLEEVIGLLQTEPCPVESYDYAVAVLDRKNCVQAMADGRDMYKRLANSYRALQEKWEELHGKWEELHMRAKQAQVEEAVDRYREMEKEAAAERDALNARRRECLKMKDGLTPQAFQGHMVEIKARKRELDRELDDYVRQTPGNLFPDVGISFHSMLRYVDGIRDKKAGSGEAGKNGPENKLPDNKETGNKETENK